jgi:tRNA nucleotidyltransferase (CCA-adding enzyme)
MLDRLGQRMDIGESFGIFGLKGYSLDIAMPRKESCRGKGHRDFDIFVDPYIGTKGAARRRDFTVNAMMQDVLSGKIIDHFGGRADLEARVIRHVSNESFAEDPLRVLRAAQFAARFEFSIAEETVTLCKNMDISTLPRERILGEVEKALLKAKRPSLFFEWMRKMDQLSVWFPELQALIGIEQNPKYHAEGDVWVHTMMMLDVAAGYKQYSANPLGFMLSAVAHDFGKATCTHIVNGEIHAYEHEIAGIPLARDFIQRITGERALIKYLLNMVEHHMKPNVLASVGASVKSTNKLFDAAIDPEGLICLAIADGLGKISPRKYLSYNDFFRERIATYREYISRPYVTGADLIAAGLKPDEAFSDYLAYAHKLRLAGIEKDSALRQTLAYARKNTNSRRK